MNSAERLTPASVAPSQPAANALVLESGIDLNSPAAGVTELTGSVSEPVTIEFTIGEE